MSASLFTGVTLHEKKFLTSAFKDAEWKQVVEEDKKEKEVAEGFEDFVQAFIAQNKWAFDAWITEDCLSRPCSFQIR